jgi:predicted ATPase/DNA-binding CsgD family transcriptional regulator
MGGMAAGAVTPREAEVLALLGDHLTHAEIAARLVLSIRTVESHVASLRRKLDLPGHRDLVRYAAAERRGVTPSPPTALTSFVGRAEELDAAVTALAQARLVSLVGPGGAGKTRLARELVARLGPASPDAVYFVDLIPVAEPETLASAVAEACDLADQPGADPVSALAGGLARARSLLVLDNCEHVADGVAGLVGRLLAACDGLSVLVTSRTRLALTAERVVQVGPMHEGDAVELFCRRAVAAGWPEPGADERERAATVCRGLDGLALAVELAAVRLPSLGLDGVERALARQPELLTTRQRSMRDTLEWSCALLSARDQALLARLAVFVSGFDLDAATTLAGSDPTDGLARLVEQSLVVAEPDGRWRLLEPVRQFVLARGPSQAAYAAHASWATALAAGLTAPGTTGRTTALDPVVDELRAALAWLTAEQRSDEAAGLAHDLATVLFRSGRLREAQLRFEQAARLTEDPRVRASRLAEAAEVAKCRTLGDAAHRLELEAVEVVREAAPDALGPVARRAAETVTRFEGMFEELPDPGVHTELLALATPAPEGDLLVESAALDSRTGELVEAGEVDEAATLARHRVNALLGVAITPATALELKDALHMAVLTCVGAGDLDAALRYAETQLGLPFLREQRDVVVDELLLPLALADADATLATAASFEEDWHAAGRPVAPGRAIGPAAVALLHGRRGDVAARRHWLAVAAAVRGVPTPLATEGTGYGEVFDAALALHRGRPADAAAALARVPPGSWWAGLFTRWRAELAAQLPG